MAYKIEGKRHFIMECPAYQEIQTNFQELFHDCEGNVKVACDSLLSSEAAFFSEGGTH